MKNELPAFENNSKINNIYFDFISSKNLVTVVQVLPNSVIHVLPRAKSKI